MYPDAEPSSSLQETLPQQPVSHPFYDRLSWIEKKILSAEQEVSAQLVAHKNMTPIRQIKEFVFNYLMQKNTSILPNHNSVQESVHIPETEEGMQNATPLQWTIRKVIDRFFLQDDTAHVETVPATDAWMSFVSEQLNVPLADIQRYHTEYTDEIEPFLKEQERKALQKTNQTELYGKMAETGIWYTLIRAKKPERIVETGLGQGTSALTAIMALQKNAQEGSQPGKLFTVSYADEDYTYSDGALIKYDDNWENKWQKHWELIEGDSLDKLPPLLKELGTLDMFLHDSNHTLPHMIAEFEMAYPYLSDNGILSSDDAHIPIPLSKPYVKFCNVMGIPHRLEGNFGFGFVKKKDGEE